MIALLADLHAKGLLDLTLVVLGTEFGCKPRINDTDGRDHHMRAIAPLLAGAGINSEHAQRGTPTAITSLEAKSLLGHTLEGCI